MDGFTIPTVIRFCLQSTPQVAQASPGVPASPGRLANPVFLEKEDAPVGLDVLDSVQAGPLSILTLSSRTPDAYAR